MNAHKKIEYCNFMYKTIYLGLETNLPSIMKIKTQSLEIPQKGI